MLTAADYAPPRWLRNAHVQSVLGSSPLRRRTAEQRLAAAGARTEIHLLETAGGVRLQGLHSAVPGARPHGLVLLLHGWEGSADSMYVLSLGSYLFDLGCDIYRLNFRDHGPSHHLNEEIFLSCRLDEVVGAVGAIQRAIAGPRLTLAGFSLGGNFALRVAARAPAAGIVLERAIGICPVLRPHTTMDVLEQGPFIYHRYFISKWKQSLQLKQRIFPKRYDFAAILAQRSIKEMTRIMVEQYSEFPTLDAYLSGYAIVGDRLAQLAVPSHILLSLDDPIIPARDLPDVARSSQLEIEAIPHGGHCGFMESFVRESWADRQVARYMGLL